MDKVFFDQIKTLFKILVPNTEFRGKEFEELIFNINGKNVLVIPKYYERGSIPSPNIYGNLIHNIQALNNHLTDLDNIVLIVNHTIPDFVLDFFEQKFKDSTKIIQVYDANSLATTFLEYGLSLNTLFPAVTYSQFRKPFLPEIYKALGHQSNDDK